MDGRRPAREPGPRSGGSRRGIVLALASGTALVLGAAWFLRERAQAPLAPSGASRSVPSGEGAPVTLVDPSVDGPDATASAQARTELAPAVVDLVVRVVERSAHEPRPGELRPVLRGVPGVRATWDGGGATTSDPDGLLRFEGLPPRAGELRVAPVGELAGWSGTLDLGRPSGGLRRSGGALTFEVELRADLGRFGGRVQDAEGRPVAGAWVALVRGEVAQRRSPAEQDLFGPPVRSDADGRFEVPVVRGEARLELLVVPDAEGLPLGHVRTLNAQEANGVRDVLVELPPTRRVHVRVLTADGASAAGRVGLQRDGARWPADLEPRLAHTSLAAELRAQARDSGELEAELADGAWVVHFVPSARESSRALFQFTLAPEGETQFEFRLPEPPPRD